MLSIVGDFKRYDVHVTSLSWSLRRNCRLLWCVIGVAHGNSAVCVVQYVIADAAQNGTSDGAQAPWSHHNKFGVILLGLFQKPRARTVFQRRQVLCTHLQDRPTSCYVLMMISFRRWETDNVISIGCLFKIWKSICRTHFCSAASIWKTIPWIVNLYSFKQQIAADRNRECLAYCCNIVCIYS